ncbi:MAG: single-stranded-DNA-specific exonuclease RecJ [Coriobacteriia bacterium]
MTDARWRMFDIDESLVTAVAGATGLSAITAGVLVARGLTDPAGALRFLDPAMQRDWHDPSLIPGMNDAARRVAAAVSAEENIVVFGDFDLDGISSAALTCLGLRALGATVSATVPNRFREGYGLTQASIERLARMRPDLIITVDCGISAGTSVVALRELGIDVVVTDHHEPGDEVPQGIPVANPKLDPACVSSGLAGAGVALKLIQSVGRELGKPDLWRDLTDLATLGTIADIVPLVGENRALVADGLVSMRAGERVSIAALAQLAGVAIDGLTAEQIAFGLAPRLNAAGRMADPSVALDLLMSTDPARAQELAQVLDEHNRVRQAVEQDLSAAAFALAEREFVAGDRAVVLAGEGWHEGVKGIVASRLTSSYGLPSLLFAIEDGQAIGSGRSVGTVDLFAAVDACSDLLVRYGGHAAAVGVTLAAGDLPAFKERLLGVMAALPSEQFVTDRTCDGRLELQDISIELAAELELLAPFGHGNPRPLFCSRSVFMNTRQRVGRTANHLRFTAFDGVASVPAIAFRCRDIEEAAEHDAPIDIAYEVTADEWRGRRRVQLLVRDYEIRKRSPEYAPAADLVEDLFAHADEILAREEYSGIAEATSFHTKLAGVTFEGRQDVVTRLASGVPLRAARQPENPYDTAAIALYDTRGEQVGFFNRRLAAVLAPLMDAGIEYDVEVTDVTGGGDGRSMGVNVLVSRRGETDDEEDAEDTRLAARAQLAALSPRELDQALIELFIGDRQLHVAQRTSLDALASGERCLTVMATGRGKSLIFHLHAARRALRDGAASVFVFPLRALVADQAFHLQEAFSSAGVRVCTLTGESSPTRRDEVYAALTAGEMDVVLTTPEYLEHHAASLAACGRIGFVVIDEAHHVGTARAGHRPAYTRLGAAIDILGSPDVLAVTATAGNEIASTIREVLAVSRVIEDPTVRENLIVEDARGLSDKEPYLAALAARGDKLIVYVNSREQSVRLARMLRKRVPEISMRVAFYNGGLGRTARHAVERAFRDGDVRVIVATSAFGEGVNIPDIRDVVLYHLPFNDIEFNQMSGRAGRDGAPARIHMLFGEKDGRVNEMVLSSVAPDREDMAALYLALKDMQVTEGEGFEITNAELAERVLARRAKSHMNDRGVSSAVGVFRELGLVEGEGHGAYRKLTVLPAPDRKLDLAESIRYAEGLEEIAEFDEFRTWVLGATADELLARFNRPILPSTQPAASQGL